MLQLLWALQMYPVRGQPPLDWTTRDGCRGRKRESNCDNISESISRCPQEVAMLSSGYFWPMQTYMLMSRTHTHTDAISLIVFLLQRHWQGLMVGSTQPPKYAVISGWIFPHVSFRFVWITYIALQSSPHCLLLSLLYLMLNCIEPYLKNCSATVLKSAQNDGNSRAECALWWSHSQWPSCWWTPVSPWGSRANPKGIFLCDAMQICSAL